MKIEYQKVDALIPYENNPRVNDGAVEAVAASINEFGFKNPIIVDKNNVIICGHSRLKAAKKLGLDEVPTIRAEDLTEEQVRAFRLADNKTAELAEWDEERLEDELHSIEDLYMAQFGFDDIRAELDALNVQEDDFEIKDEEDEPRAKRGDIYQLGEHRLMCGDSTSETDMKKLMNGQQADMVFTDPPYGVAIGSKNKAINEVEPGRGGALKPTLRATHCRSMSFTRCLSKRLQISAR